MLVNSFNFVFDTMQKRGYMEGVFQISRYITEYVICKIRTSFLKLRLYNIPYSTRLNRNACLNQSRKHAIKFRENIELGEYVRVTTGFNGKISIGKDTHIYRHTIVDAQSRITIGSNVLIAPYCYIVDYDHKVTRSIQPILKQGYVRAPIVIEDNVWIGAHAIILKGVTIGKGAVIGAGSIVTKNIPAYSVAFGNPAQVKRNRR